MNALSSYARGARAIRLGGIHALVILATALPAQAFDFNAPGLGSTSLDFTNTLLFRYINESFGTGASSDDILTVLNKMNAIATVNPFTVGVRFDMAYFPLDECSWQPDDNCPRQDYTRVEKIYGTWNHALGTTTVGDFYASFGRGITLSVRKADELGLDTSIRGAKADVRVGPWTLQALGGSVNAHNVNLAQARDVFIRDPDDKVAGLQTGFLLDSGVEVAVRGVHYWYDRAATLGHEESAGVGGATLSLLDLGPASLSIEAAFLRHEDYDPEAKTSRVRNGEAVYATLSGHFGGLSTLLEFKHYDTFDLAPPDDTLRNAFIRYNEPPTLERIDQLVPSFADATGGRLLLEYYFPSTSTRVYANGVVYAYGEGLGSDQFGEKGNWVAHGYAGVSQYIGRVSFDVSGGYREDRDNKKGEFHRTLLHGELEVNAPLVGTHAIALKWWHRQEKKRLFRVKEFELGMATLTYSVNPGLKFSVIYGYNTEFKERDPVHYAAGQIDWTYWESSSLRLFAGTIPGGIVCAGGTCVQVPAFESYSMQLVTRF